MFFDIWCVDVCARLEDENRSQVAKESSFMPWIAVDHKMNTLKNFIVSTETFIFFRSDPLAHDSLTHLTHKTSVLVAIN